MLPAIHHIVPDGTAKTFKDIVANVVADDRIFRIDLGGKYVADHAVSDGFKGFQGIELLRWLRVKGVNNHCILTGFLPRNELLDLIKDDVRKAIVATRGTTYVQLPSARIEAGEAELADEDQIKSLFRLDMDLREIRHNEANAYGLRKLREHHSLVEPETGPSGPDGDGDIIHEIVRYVFSTRSAAKPTPEDVRLAKRRLDALRAVPDKSVIYVDDQAKKGWSDFLKVVLGPCSFVEIVPAQTETPDSLYRRITASINQNGGWIDFVNRNHLFISDLKLLDREREVTNYKELLCYKTLEKLRPVGRKGERDTRLRTMYFTASNDLSKVKGLLENKDCNPHLIFTKEGADQLLTPQQSFRKYAELLDSLLKLLAPRPKKKVLENLQIINLNEEGERHLLAYKYLTLLYEQQLFGRTQRRSVFDRDINDAEEIYIDTNFFVAPEFAEPLVELLMDKKDKIRVAATVRHELKCLGGDGPRGRGLRGISAAFFGKLIDELNINVVEHGLTPYQQDRIAQDRCDYEEDFADKHLDTLLKSLTSRTVLLTDDKRLSELVGGRRMPNIIIKRVIGRTAGEPAPGRQVEGGGPHVASRRRHAPKGAPRAAQGRHFRVGLVKLSKGRTSYVFFSEDKAQRLAIERTKFGDKTLEELQGLKGATITTTSTAADLIKMLAWSPTATPSS
jgi:hypothetical protein